MNWSPLIQTTDEFQLQLIRSLLDSANIPHQLQGFSGIRLLPLGAAGSATTNRMVGATIRVPEDRLEEAQALIRETAEPTGEEDRT